MEPIVEKIAVWIKEEIDGVQDPDGTLTLRAVRPAILDWQAEDYNHGDVILEVQEGETLECTTSSRKELGAWKLYGIVTTLPADTAADTVLIRVAETIRRTMLSGNKRGRACGGLAYKIHCPKAEYSDMPGGVVIEVTVLVEYFTDLFDGYKK